MAVAIRNLAALGWIDANEAKAKIFVRSRGPGCGIFRAAPGRAWLAFVLACKSLLGLLTLLAFLIIIVLLG